MGEPRHFKIGILIDTEEYSACVIDYPKTGCVQDHETYKYLEICLSDNQARSLVYVQVVPFPILLSEMVQLAVSSYSCSERQKAN